MLGLPWWLRQYIVCLLYGRLGFDPWRRKWQPTPVSLPGKIPWTEEPGRLQSTGVAKSWTKLSYFTFTLLLVRETKTNLDGILKSRDFIKKETLPTKVRLAKAVVFPVVMYGYESWTIKKTEC